MEDIIKYLNSKGQSALANQALNYIEEQKKGREEVEELKKFRDFVVQELKRRDTREKIVFGIAEEARKLGYIR